MTAGKILALLRALQKATDQGKVTWEGTAADHVFRVWVGDRMVKIGEFVNSAEGEGNTGRPCYRAWVLNSLDEVVDAMECSGGAEFVVLEQLFQSARRRARNSDQVLDEMLKALQTGQ
jgi:hypothetical protein